MYLEIITPDRKIFSGDVTSVHVPGTNGQFQILKNHAPIISTLVKGTIRIKTTSGNQSINVRGGVVEVLHNKIIVLAESA